MHILTYVCIVIYMLYMFVEKEESRNLQTIVLKADETKCFSETENLHSRCRKGSYRDISLSMK